MSGSESSKTNWVRVVFILAAFLGCIGLPVLLNIRENSWRKVSSLPARAVRVEPAPQSQCGTFSFTSPPIPNTAIASYEVCAYGFDGATFIKYIVLDDGSIWEWQATVDMMGGFGQTIRTALLMTLGAVIGLLAGSAIVLFVKASQQVKQKSAKGKPDVV